VNIIASTQLSGRVAAGLTLLLIAGCGSLLPKSAPPPAFYGLNGPQADPRVPPFASGPAPEVAARPTLIVGPPHAAAGFDSARIVYVRSGDHREYFARSAWVDTPARMLSPLIVAAVGAGSAFRAVVAAPSAAAGDLRLDTEIVRLQQTFGPVPSRVRFTLRAYLVVESTRQVLAWQEFDASEAAESEDPLGGIAAAQRAVRVVLAELTAFCARSTVDWPPSAPGAP
jgi:cholesterol transport system auxiliary component